MLRFLTVLFVVTTLIGAPSATRAANSSLSPEMHAWSESLIRLYLELQEIYGIGGEADHVIQLFYAGQANQIETERKLDVLGPALIDRLNHSSRKLRSLSQPPKGVSPEEAKPWIEVLDAMTETMGHFQQEPRRLAALFVAAVDDDSDRFQALNVRALHGMISILWLEIAVVDAAKQEEDPNSPYYWLVTAQVNGLRMVTSFLGAVANRFQGVTVDRAGVAQAMATERASALAALARVEEISGQLHTAYTRDGVTGTPQESVDAFIGNLRAAVVTERKMIAATARAFDRSAPLLKSGPLDSEQWRKLQGAYDEVRRALNLAKDERFILDQERRALIDGQTVRQ